MSQAKPGSWQTSQKICLCALDKAGQEGCDPGGREMEEAMKQNVGGKCGGLQKEDLKSIS